MSSEKSYQSAIRMLARREHSCFELRRKLEQRGYSIEAIDHTVTKLITQDLLSDERFVESYLRSRITKGYGPLRIMAELSERGVSKELAQQCLKAINVESVDGEVSQIEQVRSKKFGANLPTTAVDRAKQMRYLQYRGFSFDQIAAAISKR